MRGRVGDDQRQTPSRQETIFWLCADLNNSFGGILHEFDNITDAFRARRGRSPVCRLRFCSRRVFGRYGALR